ncbi:MAG: NAD(P)-dependent oxidoreductase [Phycisphaeraceae bacterium]|nr:NAD(P)-dependent oxidoreductase [Phycisphaeraceae bacterium]
MKLLITGGAGFIGRYFVELLRGQGVDIAILDLVKPAWDAGGIPCHVGDVRDPQAVRSALAGRDAVLHLAAAHHDFGIERDTYFTVNEQGSRILCDEMDRAGISRVCFFSSVAVFGDAPEPHHEDAPTNPTNPYGASKLAGEMVFKAWVERGQGRSCLVVRPTITFGPRNFANMFSLIRQIDSGKFAQVGEGTNVKSLSYVENIVPATMFLWSKPIAEVAGAGTRRPFEVYNFVDKPDLASAEIARVIYAALGKPSGPLRVPMWVALALATPFDVVIRLTGKNLPVSSARIKKLFATRTLFEADKLAQAGWKSPTPLAEGIRRMVAWYQAEGKGQPAVWRVPPKEIGGVPGLTRMGAKAEARS